MNKPPNKSTPPQNSLPGFRLEIRPSTDAEREADAKLTAYRRKYWQRYKRQVKRVFGTLEPADHAALKVRAEQNNRSIWSQLWAESEAYRRKSTVPTSEIEEQQKLLLIELRRIGNNMNQIARLGHVRASRRDGVVPRDGDSTGDQVAELFEDLEKAVTKLSDGR